MVQLNFDANTVSPGMGFESIPAGWYNVMIVGSEGKPTKDGTGSYLQFEFQVLDGQYAGRKLFTNLNLNNKSAQAVEIARKELSAIAHAVGIMQIPDSNVLHNLPMKGKVKVRKDKDGQYDDQNEFTQYKNINAVVDGPVGGTGAVAFGQQQTPPPTGQPWAANPAQQPQQQQQPWQQPQQQPQQQQPPQQTWQPPAAQQPWQQPVQAPAAQQPPAQQPQQYQPQVDPNVAQQPWMQQQQQPQQPPQGQQPVQQPAMQQHPAQTAMPPWMQPPTQ